MAPPTFAAVISARGWDQLFSDPELELSLERTVHGDQRFTFMRPLHAGDVVIATVTIDKVRVRSGSELISATVDIASRDGEPICTAQATFAHALRQAGWPSRCHCARDAHHGNSASGGHQLGRGPQPGDLLRCPVQQASGSAR